MVIGYSFALPCNRILMDKFMSNKINESELFKEIKKLKLTDTPETIYLCASVVKKEFRRQGLATKAFVKMIDKITSNEKKKPILFAWAYSKEGGKLARKIAEITELKLKERK